MKKLLLLIFLAPLGLFAQSPENNEVFQLIPVTTTEMNGILNPVAGSVVFNTDSAAMFYFDGAAWVQQIPGTGKPSTAGQVIINQDITIQVSADAAAITPQATNFTPLIYPDPSDLQISFPPITQWPDNEENPGDDAVYNSTTNAFLENQILGQTHIWRIIVEYIKPSQERNNAIGIIFRTETSSGFSQDYTQVTPQGISNGELVFNVITIADETSLADGYTFSASTDADNPITLIFKSITRVSLQN